MHVPYERCFVLGDPELCNGFYARTSAVVHMTHQVVTRTTAKTEYILGLVSLLAQAIGIEQFGHVQGDVAEVITTLETLRALLRAAEADAAPNEFGVLTPAWAPLNTARNLYPKLYQRFPEILRKLGASGLMATPTAADVSGPAAADIETYLQSATLGTHEENQTMTAEASIATARPRSPTSLAAMECHDAVITDLVSRVRNGDKQAWDTLVGRYAPLIWSICRKYELRGPDAEDVGQSVWLHLLDHLDRVRDPAALPGWLATTARRECIRVLRGRHDAGQAPNAENASDGQVATAEEELLAAERHAALRGALMGLPPFCQQLIALLIEDPPVPYAEISARLGIPVGSIGPSRRRCLDKLRRDPAIAALISAEAETAT